MLFKRFTNATKSFFFVKVSEILDEIKNGEAGFNFTLNDVSLEKLTKGPTSTELVVNIDFKSTSKPKNDFGAILRRFKISKLINGSGVTASGS